MAAFKLTKSETAEFQKLVDAYDAARAELSEWLDDIASDWETEFEDRSEKWQESEAGQTAQERIATVRGWHDEFPSEFDANVEDLT